MERVQPIAQQSTEAVPSLGVMEGTLPPFEALAQAAREGKSGALDELRSAVSACPPTLRGAESLIALLESGLLEALSFDRTPAREAAIEKLLTLDVYALRVPPEQLEWLRGLQLQRRWVKVGAVIAAMASVAFAVGEYIWLTT